MSNIGVAKRHEQFQDADVFMLCFAVDSVNHTEENVIRWIAEIRNVEPSKPIAVILTKNDLLERPDVDQRFNEYTLQLLKQNLGLQLFCSTSCLDDTDTSVNEAFEQSILEACKYKFGRAEEQPTPF